MMAGNRLIQALAVFTSVAALASADSASVFARGLVSVPLMPRIPSLAKHMEVLASRALGEADGDAVADIKCLEPKQDISLHDENEALLSICGGMSGANQRCNGAPSRTEALSGTAKVTVTAVDEGATIVISKKAWLNCVRAARDACPTGSLSAVCVGGASTGDVAFTLAEL